jgi:hypothetical protein
MRIIAAEVTIAPLGQPEVEVGMLPLDLDLPGPPPGMSAAGIVTVRLTLHTSRGDLTIRHPVRLDAEEPLEQTEAPEEVNLPREQYRALLRSAERRAEPPERPGSAGSHARLPRRPSAPCDHAAAQFTTDCLERIQERWAHAGAPG